MIKKVLQIIALICLLLFLSIKKGAIINNVLHERKIVNINSSWQYLENNTEILGELKNIDGWEDINLPHTWNQWDAVDNTPGYRRDASWYQKNIFIKDYENAHYYLKLESANITSDIYINGKKVSQHIGGYIGFEIDITPFIDLGNQNTISIRVDNSYNPDVIPSQKADFFIYGGITRDVWLKIVPEVNIANVHISAPEISENEVSTQLKIDIRNPHSPDKEFKVRGRVIDPQTDRVVSEKTIKYADLLNDQSLLLPAIQDPVLWSPKNPKLYNVVTQILDGDKVIDQTTIPFGYRWFNFEDNGAFFLNGERLLLRGTHRHEEHAGYGAAMPNHLHRKDIEQIKEIGANFLRLGHYPQDPEIYKACNELGIIVWDELPWCRGGLGGDTWKNNTEKLLKEQIHQNYNHPSILFWSLGNEIYWLPDFEGGGDEKEMNAYVRKLNDIAHELDHTRLTAIRKYYAGADLVDVFSPSIWSGWYAGVYTNYEKSLTENQKKYQRFLHMEYGGSSHVGRHTENPISGDGMMDEDNWAEVANQVNIKNVAKEGDWTENYIVDLFDWYLGITETKNDLSGTAQWAFKDFGTPLRPENAIPYLNQKGLVDRSGKPKDAYYVFKSYWSEDPFTYIESHTWKERRGPEGLPRNLSVFSNCETVELIHNNASLGSKEKIIGSFPASGLNWDVHFKKGENTLIANGFNHGKKITSDTLVVNYDYAKAEKPDKIVLTYQVLNNGNYLIEAIMKDKNGERVLNYEKHIYFSKDGTGEFLKDYGTPTRSQVIQMANGYAAIEMKGSHKGKAIIEARNQDFKGSYLVIDFEKENNITTTFKSK